MEIIPSKNLNGIDLFEIPNYRNYLISQDGEIWTIASNKFMKLKKNKYGYMCLSIKNDLGKTKTISAHRLVAISLIPNPENKPQVNHINGIKHDNRIENLEWCTRSENSQHAIKTGLTNYRYGQYIYNSQVTDADALIIFNDTRSVSEISKDYNVSRSIISCIKKGRTFNHVTGLAKNINGKDKLLFLKNFSATKKYYNWLFESFNYHKLGLFECKLTGKVFNDIEALNHYLDLY